MKKQLVLIIGLMSSLLPAHTLNEIQQLIISADYSAAISEIKQLPRERVADRQQLLLNMLDAWLTDARVGMFAIPIRKAADSLVGGNRNVIYSRIGHCMRTMWQPTAVMAPLPTEEPIADVPAPLEPPLEASEPLLEQPVAVVIEEPKAPIEEMPEPVEVPLEPTEDIVETDEIPAPIIPPPIIIEPIILPEPPRFSPAPHKPSFIRHAAALATFIGIGIACIWGLLVCEKKQDEPAIPEAPPLGTFAIPKGGPIVTQSALEAAIQAIREKNKKPSGDSTGSNPPQRAASDAIHIDANKPKRIKLTSPEIGDTDTAEAAQAKISSYCDQIQSEQHHFAQSVSAHQKKGKLKSTEHRMLVQRHNRLKDALRDLNQSLEPNNPASAKLSDADKKELNDRATTLTIEIMNNEQLLADLRALIEDPQTMKFSSEEEEKKLFDTRRLNIEVEVG